MSSLELSTKGVPIPPWVWVLAAILWPVCLLLYATLVPSPDHSFYQYTGWMITQGATPYVTFVDGSWPFCHWLLALSTLTFGTELWSWRVFDFVVVVIPCTVVGADLLRRTWGVSAGVWFLLLYPALYITPDYWSAGQRDVVAANLLIACLWCYWVGLTNGRLRWQVGTGAWIAVAAMLKPPFAFMGIALAIHAVVGVRMGRWNVGKAATHIAVAGAASMGCIALAVLVLVAQGVPAETLYDYCLRLATSRVGVDYGGPWVLLEKGAWTWVHDWHWILFSTIVATGLALRRGGLQKLPEFLLFPTLWVTGVVSYFSQVLGLGYTLGPTFTAAIGIMCIGFGIAVDHALTNRGWLRWAVLAWVLLALLGTGKKWHRHYGDTFRLYAGVLSEEEFNAKHLLGDGIDVNEALQVSQELRSMVPPDGTVLVWGRANVINVLSQRPQPTRFFHNVMLFTPGRPNDIAQRFDEWFREDLEANRPEYCLVNREEFATYPLPLAPSVTFLESFLAKNYDEVRPIGHSVLYRRRDLAN
ncbi:MAG: glycosyltransferase family 39 protein [Polyangiales bacterium]